MKWIGVALLATTKFMMAPSGAVALNYNFWETLLITIPAGILGILTYYFSASALMDRAAKKKLEKKQKAAKMGKVYLSKNFTPKNKFIIKFKQRFGLWGLALLTPIFPSIPVGSILCAKFFKRRKETLPALILGVVFWGIALTTISLYVKG